MTRCPLKSCQARSLPIFTWAVGVPVRGTKRPSHAHSRDRFQPEANKPAYPHGALGCEIPSFRYGCFSDPFYMFYKGRGTPFRGFGYAKSARMRLTYQDLLGSAKGSLTGMESRS